MSDQERGLLSRLVSRTGRYAKNSLALVGFAAVVGAAVEYQRLVPATQPSSSDDDKEEKKKKVLVVPFHRIQIVDQKKTSFPPSSFPVADKDERVMRMELQELVDLLHHAAQDPDITCLYGIFGHGSALSQTGWADLEEVRNALRVFRESHRTHHDPNLDFTSQVIRSIPPKKPLYCYADQYSGLGDPANKEYYLASIFTHVHLAQHGQWNLFGLMAQGLFLRDFLERQRITVHVFKHGPYKNAPNSLTEMGFNKPHREQMTNLLSGLNGTVWEEIFSSRSKQLQSGSHAPKAAAAASSTTTSQALWKRLVEKGSFSAQDAHKAGLVDYLPRRDPLPDLLASNKKDEAYKETCKQEWNHQETDFDHFPAQQAVQLTDYAKAFRKSKAAKERLHQWHSYAEKYPMLQKILPNSNESSSTPLSKEKVALVHVSGMIGDVAARKVVQAIRKIRMAKDTKCVVVRVNSTGGSIYPCETILQELKALEIPVVFSFGNVSASGGYYIASNADRIFCSPKTVTGSIGVFGIRPDLRGLAFKYGVRVKNVALSELAPMHDFFSPMTRKMQKIMAESIDNFYEQFKTVVAQGRGMTVKEVESIAQGRVWTGEQAEANGLVDELGGLHRAISYAKRKYCRADADAAQVEVWPKKLSLLERLQEMNGEGASAQEWMHTVYAFLTGANEPVESDNSNLPWNEMPAGLLPDLMMAYASNGLPGTLSHVMLTMDENTAIQCMLGEALSRQQQTRRAIHTSAWV